MIAKFVAATLLVDGKEIGTVDIEDLRIEPAIGNYANAPPPIRLGGLPAYGTPDLFVEPAFTQPIHRIVKAEYLGILPMRYGAPIDREPITDVIDAGALHVAKTFELRADDLPIRHIRMAAVEGHFQCQIIMQARDRDDMFRDPVEVTDSTERAYHGDPAGIVLWILNVLRERIRCVLLHEIDECLYVSGQRKWDPHAKFTIQVTHTE